ncbi:MAG: 2'-5' RNA ligase family protein [Bdellovibrionota bacterium]
MKTVGIPLILTFKLDELSQERLNLWRQMHFPKERNYLKAHLTIYHQLPGQEILSIRHRLADFAALRAPIPIHFDRLMSRQGFVGVGVTSDEMLAYKTDLNTLFLPNLRAQDKEPYRPHVTVTNKGSPRDGEAVLRILEEEFRPWSGTILGLELYHYRGGPWEFAQSYIFDAPKR